MVFDGFIVCAFHRPRLQWHSVGLRFFSTEKWPSEGSLTVAVGTLWDAVGCVLLRPKGPPLQAFLFLDYPFLRFLVRANPSQGEESVLVYRDLLESIFFCLCFSQVVLSLKTSTSPEFFHQATFSL